MGLSSFEAKVVADAKAALSKVDGVIQKDIEPALTAFEANAAKIDAVLEAFFPGLTKFLTAANQAAAALTPTVAAVDSAVGASAVNASFDTTAIAAIKGFITSLKSLKF